MTDSERAAYVDAAAALAGLDLGPYRDGVLGYFAVAAGMAAVLDAFPLDAHDESLEAFRPVVPDA